MTDIITLFISIYFAIRGAARGFMKSLLVPVSIIIATLLSIFYYQTTSDLIVSLIIGLIGPLIIYFALKYLLKTWAKATDSEIKPGFFSRLGGSLLSLAWGWVFITFTLILLAALPPWGKSMTDLHNDVTKSASYFFVKPLGKFLFANPNQIVPSAAGNAGTPAASNDAKSLAEDPRFQKILQDPEVQKDIDAHDIIKLMRNPKMIELTQQIISDPDTMKKVMALYNSQTPSLEDKNPQN